MGREVRRVPAHWQHPKEYNSYRGEETYKPLYDANWRERAEQWDIDRAKWESGERPDYASEYAADFPFDQYEGQRPFSEDYMPSWPDAERTHLMMYEDTTEGTPISPAFETPEELARWLADNGASSFGSSTATYEQWLPICKGGWAPSMVVSGGFVQSGVEFLAASRIEAAPADETRSGSAEGESLTGEAGDAQPLPPSQG